MARVAQILAMAGLLTAGLPAAAQSLVYELPGETGSDYYALSVDGGGDFNGDGHPDIFVGGYRGSYLGQLGLARVYSGIDGSILLELNGVDHGSGVGNSVAFLGDTNGDGHSEVTAGHFSFVPTDVFSGASATPLFQLPSASHVHNAGDLNGDSINDILNRDEVYSGLDGSLILSFAHTPAYFSPAGDVDADGIADIIAYRPTSAPHWVRVFSGADAALLHDIPLPDVFSGAHGIGDVDADGKDDFAIDLSSYLTTAVDVHSGATGQRLYGLPGIGNYFGNIQLLGRTVSAAGDIDADGHGDIIVSGPYATLVSGATGCTLARLRGDLVGTYGVHAFAVAALGDINGDGSPEFVLGDPSGHAPHGGGKAAVFSYDGPTGQATCSSTPNSTGLAAVMSATGSTSIAANDLLLTAINLPADTLAIYFYGGGQTQLPFGNGLLCIDAGATGVFRLPLEQASATGCLMHELDIMNPPAGGQLSAGSTWYFQAWFRDPAAGGAAFDLSDARQLDFLP